jgi:RES domain-containing protein
MIPAATNFFSPALRGIPGRSESGRWLRAMPAHRIRDLLDPYQESLKGGRVNPPGSFPVLYAVADEEGCRPALAAVQLNEPETVVAVFSVVLSRVLDLADGSIRRKLGVTVSDLANADESRISQAIGMAAYNEGFEGVIYPRPLNPKCRNLAIFSDRITSRNIQLLELRTPGLPSRACEG